MRITKTAGIIFPITFLIGCAFGAIFISQIPIKSTKQENFALINGNNDRLEKLLISPILPAPNQPVNDDYEDKLGWVEDYDRKYKIKLLTTGTFHGDEVKAKSGETWLGLFKQDDGFELRPAKLIIKRVQDVIEDGNSNRKTGKEVGVRGKDEPLFLLKNAGFLKQTKIKTLFYEDPENASDEMRLNNTTRKTFQLNNIDYKLSVATANPEKSEYLDASSRLVLSDGKIEQVIYSQKMCDDCGWGMFWAGDLDGDGKLDLFLDLVNHYNVAQWRLFLSSQAGKGKLVKEVANFRIVGC